MVVCEKEKEIPYGVVNVKNFKFIIDRGKTNKKFFINVGIYVLQPEILNYLKKTFYDMPEFLIFLRIKRKKLLFFR